jgi:alpha-amylase/alpha-mannosidase (GH57 family)
MAMAKNELAVALLWHMHQPDYVDVKSGRASMPWVRLHALFNYYDMVRVLEESPGTRVVFNLAPILLEQLAAMATGDVTDDFLELARPAPGDLSGTDRALLLERFFAFHHGRRFKELPRLGELWQKRDKLSPRGGVERAAQFSDQELLDLQVGFHLAWSGRTLREDDLVANLIRKQQGFTAGEKSDLLQLQHEFLARILPAYRDAAAGGRVEISCTPYAHPILPLLCDTNSALEATPHLPLPATRLQQPGDAWYHARTALDAVERYLGVRPAGMWPAEGSVSEDAVTLFAQEGIQWIASDQDVLTASAAGSPLPAGLHFQPFRWGGSNYPVIFFRDKGLSDRIGFVYSTWSAKRAVVDFVALLQQIRSDLPKGRFVVPIILDGENPWESYPDQGVPFLQELYRTVHAADGLSWTTFTEFLSSEGGVAAAPLARICAGSWIRHDFTTWIGHPEKNRGWECLSRVRDWLQEQLAAGDALRSVTLPGDLQTVFAPDPGKVGPGCDTDLARAWRAMVAAQGSDWFWWYGDDHPTPFKLDFDVLFRAHLTNCYHILGAEPDPALARSLLSPETGTLPRFPRFPLRVVLDGRVTSYFEWLDAGWYEPWGGSAMQRTDSVFKRLYYGCDTNNLFVRLDPSPETELVDLAGMVLEVRSARQVDLGASLRFPPELEGPGRLEPSSGSDPGVAGAFDQVVEIGVPWRQLGVQPNEQCEFYVSLLRGREVELVLPFVGSLTIRVPLGPADADDWLV